MAASSVHQPRVIAIVFAAYIEDYLVRLIKTRMPGLVGSPETERKLFGSSGHLSTNAANIELAYALGLFDTTVKNELITVARIRNRFAHNVSVNTFEHHEIDTLCKKLTAADVTLKEFPMQSANAKKFFSSAATLAMMLNNMLADQASALDSLDSSLADKDTSPEMVAILKAVRSMFSTVSRQS